MNKQLKAFDLQPSVFIVDVEVNKLSLLQVSDMSNIFEELCGVDQIIGHLSLDKPCVISVIYVAICIHGTTQYHFIWE